MSIKLKGLQAQSEADLHQQHGIVELHDSQLDSVRGDGYRFAQSLKSNPNFYSAAEAYEQEASSAEKKPGKHFKFGLLSR